MDRGSDISGPLSLSGPLATNLDSSISVASCPKGCVTAGPCNFPHSVDLNRYHLWRTDLISEAEGALAVEPGRLPGCVYLLKPG